MKKQPRFKTKKHRASSLLHKDTKQDTILKRQNMDEAARYVIEGQDRRRVGSGNKDKVKKPGQKNIDSSRNVVE